MDAWNWKTNDVGSQNIWQVNSWIFVQDNVLLRFCQFSIGLDQIDLMFSVFPNVLQAGEFCRSKN